MGWIKILKKGDRYVCDWCKQEFDTPKEAKKHVKAKH